MKPKYLGIKKNITKNLVRNMVKIILTDKEVINYVKRLGGADSEGCQGLRDGRPRDTVGVD